MPHALHPDIENLLLGNGAMTSNHCIDKESRAYHGCRFNMGDLNILGRQAKITPTKAGQFVTLWKRIDDGPIQPFDHDDPIDFFMIYARVDAEAGCFVFPKSAMIFHGVMAKDGQGGKRALRVYPPWDRPTSRQAQKTQAWQSPYFVRLSLDEFAKTVGFLDE